MKSKSSNNMYILYVSSDDPKNELVEKSAAHGYYMYLFRAKKTKIKKYKFIARERYYKSGASHDRLSPLALYRGIECIFISALMEKSLWVLANQSVINRIKRSYNGTYLLVNESLARKEGILFSAKSDSAAIREIHNKFSNKKFGMTFASNSIENTLYSYFTSINHSGSRYNASPLGFTLENKLLPACTASEYLAGSFNSDNQLVFPSGMAYNLINYTFAGKLLLECASRWDYKLTYFKKVLKEVENKHGTFNEIIICDMPLHGLCTIPDLMYSEFNTLIENKGTAKNTIKIIKPKEDDTSFVFSPNTAFSLNYYLYGGGEIALNTNALNVCPIFGDISSVPAVLKECCR